VFSAAIARDARVHLPGAPYFLAGLLLLSAMLLTLAATRGARVAAVL